MIMTDWAQNEYRKKNKAFGGVSYYRIVAPAKFLNKEKYDIDVLGAELLEQAEGKDIAGFYVELAKKYDLIWTKVIDNPQAAAALCFVCGHYKIPLVVDVDDNYFETRADQPGHQVFSIGSQKRSIVGALLSLASAISVSTEPLRKFYYERILAAHGVEKKFFVLPNLNDTEEFNFLPVPKKTNKIVIGYAGSITHYSDLNLVLPVLAKLMNHYINLEFEVMGAVELEKIKELFAPHGFSAEALDRVKLKGGSEAWDKYPELLAQQEWDIGIAPLVDDEFNRGKSHIKWLEYAMYRIPTVASKVYPYYKPVAGHATIEHGKTGFLAESLDDWYKSLTALIESKALRKEVGDMAYNYIASTLQYKEHAYLWEAAIDDVLLCNSTTPPLNKD